MKLSQKYAISYAIYERQRQKQEAYLRELGLWEDFKKSDYKTMTWYIKSSRCAEKCKEFEKNKNQQSACRIEICKDLNETQQKRESNMKSYKNYETTSIGGSDIAALIMVGIGEEELQLKSLKFGGDGEYSAYIVDENAEIGAHYTKEATFYHWLTIYDDFGFTTSFSAKEINVYRAGLYGCIIQVIGNENKYARYVHPFH